MFSNKKLKSDVFFLSEAWRGVGGPTRDLRHKNWFPGNGSFQCSDKHEQNIEKSAMNKKIGLGSIE